MAMQRKKRYRLVLIKTSPLVRTMLLSAVALSTVAILALRAGIDANQKQYESMRQYAMTLEGNNQELDRRIEELGSAESAMRIAMEELGLVRPDTVVITPGN